MSNKACIKQVRIRSDGLLIKGKSISGKIFVLNSIKLIKVISLQFSFRYFSSTKQFVCVGEGEGGGRGEEGEA